MAAILIWFRRDLRLHDHPALQAALSEAVAHGLKPVPVYLHAPADEGEWATGAAGRWWLHHALADLRAQLATLGLPLVLRQGGSHAGLMRQLITETGARAVFWNRRYEPWALAVDRDLKSELKAGGIEARSFSAQLLREPWTLANKQGQPFQVYTPFAKAARASGLDAPLAESLPLLPPELRSEPPSAGFPASEPLEALGLLPQIPWHEALAPHWQISEAAALGQLDTFLAGPVGDYGALRDSPAVAGTSRLSPYLAFGQLSPRVAAARTLGAAADPRLAKGADKFLAELLWREFGYHLLYHFPHTPDQPLREAYARFPWRPREEYAADLRRWQRGQTGAPLVDAAMRELWGMGWMHNRVRMLVASWLAKHLLIPWQEGARWFWDTLVDADLASNTLGWQWAAGSGADAAPYFRIYNPVLQGEKFDPDGRYTRRWVPELARVPDKFLHKPWELPSAVRAAAAPGYPAPQISPEAGRRRALAVWEQFSGRRLEMPEVR